VSVHGFVKWRSPGVNLNRPSLGTRVRNLKRIRDRRFEGLEDRILSQVKTVKSDFPKRREPHVGPADIVSS
jgi:hypothetical protein